jgi:hypothetical protein
LGGKRESTGFAGRKSPIFFCPAMSNWPPAKRLLKFGRQPTV